MDEGINFSFPSFWRAPVPTTSSSPKLTSFKRANNMPGSVNQEIRLVGNGDELKERLYRGALSEHRTHNYVNRPDGEMDMMVGFFLMNGFCIFFFLLFGLCVIFSCLRRRPSLNCLRRQTPVDDIERAPLSMNVEQQPVPEILKPKFKSIVSQVIKTNKVTTTVIESDSENDELKTNHQTDNNVKVHGSNDSRSPSPPQPTNRKTSLAGCSSRKQSIEHSARRCSNAQETSAMIRHNLLGPLSFDDLYYM